MKNKLGFVALCCAFGAGIGNGVAAQDGVPSGNEVTLQEVLMDDELARFRFIVPALGQEGAGFNDVQPDFPWLCETMILPALSEAKVTADRVVISMADQAVTFGETAPDAIQFFEVFRVENGACVWEAF